MVRRFVVGRVILGITSLLTVAASEPAAPRPELDNLPEWPRPAVPPATDWLLDETPFKAGVFRGAGPNDVVLANGLLARTFRLAPNAATVGLDNLATGAALLRGVKPEAIVEIDGRRYEVGGLHGQPNYAFLRPEWLDGLRANPAACRFAGLAIGKPTERLTWNRVRHHAPGAVWPPAGMALRLDFALPDGRNIRVSVHYELYDGLPCYSKWLTVTNGTDQPLRVERFSSELLAAVERVSEVDALTAGLVPPPIHVETDMACNGMLAAGANRRSYRWLPDPDFHTQVNYEKQTPCLLDVGPDLGPAQAVKPGETFESFRVWVLPFDSTDRERQGLAVRRMYRTIAPRWTQWRTIADFYKWCRGQGIYLNVPDYYFLVGANKTGMGYREVNWSLPREQQVLHTRQNIFDGTWEKTPSMGWMFVPLTEYHGGGPAATIEPLDEHRDHYEQMLTANLACGVQACYRGPRLYDTAPTKTLVERWVDWFKTHRDIVESDLIHGRRADARDVDWMLHANPKLPEKGLLVVFNPLHQAVQRTLRVNVYYTGLSDTARVSDAGGAVQTLPVRRDYTLDLPVQLPPHAMQWFVLQ